TVGPRTPELSTKAQSGPGTATSRAATAQNAATELAAIASFPSTSRASVGKLSLIGRNMFLSFAGEGVSCGRIWRVDALDRQILAALQQDGRLTITELAALVGLSVSPCHRRL